jgi:hypothetical protein
LPKITVVVEEPLVVQPDAKAFYIDPWFVTVLERSEPGKFPSFESDLS